MIDIDLIDSFIVFIILLNTEVLTSSLVVLFTQG